MTTRDDVFDILIFPFTAILMGFAAIVAILADCVGAVSRRKKLAEAEMERRRQIYVPCPKCKKISARQIDERGYTPSWEYGMLDTVMITMKCFNKKCKYVWDVVT